MQTTVDLNGLISAMGDAVIVSDTNGAITLWNKAAEQLFGYTESEALGKTLDLIIPEHLRAPPLGWVRQDHGDRDNPVRHGRAAGASHR